MNPMRLVLPLVGALLLVAGCGGSETTSGSSAAEVAGLVPADAALLIALETDPESEQWQQADELLGRFPGRARLLDEFRDELADEELDFEDDVLPALGDETYFAFLDFEDGDDNFALITKPRDKAKFERLVEEQSEESGEPAVTREIDGWSVAAQSDEVLDRLEDDGERLDSAGWFEDAQARVEEEALVTVLANGPAIHEALQEELPEGCDLERFGALQDAAAALSAEDEGVRFRLAAVGEGAEDFVRGESLLSHVPSGAFAFLGSRGFDASLLGLEDQLRCGLEAQDAPDVERELGVSFDAIGELFAGGFALYARGGAIIPEVTLLLAPEDAEQAVATIDGLVEKVGELGGTRAERRRVGDVEARALTLGPVTLLYGAGDGKVVVTLSEKGFEALSAEGDGLEEDEQFEAARDAAGVGEGDDVFVYFDLQELVQIGRTVAGLAEEDLPREVEENLEPLGSFLAWGDVTDPNDVELGAFLTIR